MLDAVIRRKAQAAKSASVVLGGASLAKRNALLKAIASRLAGAVPSILAANRTDLKRAARTGLSPVMTERLTLNELRIAQMIRGVKDIIALPDPVGRILETVERPNGLRIEKKSVPLGVVGIIYESRPNVTIDASALCLRSGNAVLLRGGSEAIHTNKALAKIITEALKEMHLPVGCVGFVDTIDRKAVEAMIQLDELLDVVIPRGSSQFIKFIREHSRVPVIAHGEGNCHVFVDGSADLAMAEEIVFNAKVQRPSVCNAAEKLLVHEKIAPAFLPRIVARLRTAGVLIKGDAKTRSLVKGLTPATTADWPKEYLDLVIAVKIVQNLDDAISHIGTFGSHHSDAIVTGTPKNAERFLNEIDSAAVYANASTRFTDGFEFGLGAEMGISTQKLHARGPMGLSELTTVKYVIHGTGQTRV
jgi:glutamate-5-semialdehyde dehydrogenase